MKLGAEARTGVADSRNSIEVILAGLDMSAMDMRIGPAPFVALDKSFLVGYKVMSCVAIVVRSECGEPERDP